MEVLNIVYLLHLTWEPIFFWLVIIVVTIFLYEKEKKYKSDTVQLEFFQELRVKGRFVQQPNTSIHPTHGYFYILFSYLSEPFYPLKQDKKKF